MGDRDYGIDPVVSEQIASEVAEVRRLGVELAVVIGGGNIFRGLAASSSGMDRATADNMGMLATVMNALALSDALERMDARRLPSWPVVEDGILRGMVRRSDLYALIRKGRAR